MCVCVCVCVSGGGGGGGFGAVNSQHTFFLHYEQSI